MAGISRCLCLLSLLSGALPMWGCADSNPISPVSDPYQVVTISDLHFNPLYDPTLYSALVEADPSQWADIFQMSHVLTPTGGGTDTNYPLLVITLGDVKQHMRASPVVLFTGDMLGHNIPENFSCAYNNVKLPPANCPPLSQTATTAMQQFVDKTFAFVAAQIRASVGNVPVIYVPGNIDTYQVAGMGPDSNFLMNNAATIYNQLLNGGVEQQTFWSTVHERWILFSRAAGVAVAGNRSEFQFICGRRTKQYRGRDGNRLAEFATCLCTRFPSEGVDFDACATGSEFPGHGGRYARSTERRQRLDELGPGYPGVVHVHDREVPGCGHLGARRAYAHG